jgi:hypothetical protein
MADERATKATPPRPPPLLDQAGIKQLGQLAAQRWPVVADDAGALLVRASPAGRRRSAAHRRARGSRVAFSLAMLILGGAATLGMAYGTWSAVGDEEGLTLADSARLALMALLVAAFFGQLAAVARLIPGSRWIVARLSPPAPPATATPPPLLDQVGVHELSRLASPSVGGTGHARVKSMARRTMGVATWLAMVVIVAVPLALAAAAAAMNVWGHLATGGLLELGFVFQMLLLPLVVCGLAMVGRVGLAGLRDARMRNRRRLLRRALRNLLRLLDGARGVRAADPRVPGGGSSGAALAVRVGQGTRLGVASVATAGVLVLAFVPYLAIGAPDGGSGVPIDRGAQPSGGSPGPSHGITGTPDATREAEPAGGNTSPVAGSPLPTDTSAATASPAEGSTVQPVPSAPATDGATASSSSPSPSQEPTAKPTPTPSVTPTARPTRSPASTPVPKPSATPTPPPTRSPAPTPTPTR